MQAVRSITAVVRPRLAQAARSSSVAAGPSRLLSTSTARRSDALFVRE
jgi:hypothetical protein